VSSDARDRLLEATVAYVAEHGVGDLSLRRLAGELGTSHRMLIYHFGSKEGLLAAVVEAIEERQRRALADVTVMADESPVAAVWRFWEGLTDPALAPFERLFFEVAAMSLHGRPGTEALREGLVEPWLAPVVEAAERTGVPFTVARADARLGIAVARGLLLDLLATGDRAGVDAAMARFTSLYEAMAAPAEPGPP
jgi:AcrR family transcriptional regulator